MPQLKHAPPAETPCPSPFYDPSPGGQRIVIYVGGPAPPSPLDPGHQPNGDVLAN